MSAAQTKPEGAAASAPFSYAMAARGASSTASNQSSKAPSGTITPAKEQNTAPPVSKAESATASTRWADHVEDDMKESRNHSSASTAVDSQFNSGTKSPTTNSTVPVNGVTGPSSPEFGASSTSTLAREEGAASPILPEISDSAWESKSSVSGKTEKTIRGSGDRASSRGRKKGSGRRNERKEKKEADAASKTSGMWTQPVVTYTEAPPPPVNVWKMRAQQSKAPVTKASIPTLSPVEHTKPVQPLQTESKQPGSPSAAETRSIPNIVSKVENEHKAPQTSMSKKDGEDKPPSRKEVRSSSGDKPSPKVEKPAAKVTSPAVDQNAWPTPETAIAQDHKKPQEKTQEKTEEPAITHPVKGKNAWEKIDFTPTVVFNTPLPGSNPRRGGRGGGRGGREGSERNGTARSSEKRGESSAGTQSSETSRRERHDPAMRSASPSRAKRNSHDDGAARRHPRQDNPTRDGTSRSVAQDDPRAKNAEYSEHSVTHSSTGAPRQSNPPRSRVNRRENAPLTNGDKPGPEAGNGKENDTGPSSEHVPVAEAKVSASEPLVNGTSPPTEIADRKTSPAVGSPVKGQERRTNGTYSSFPGRERSERGGRGGHRGGGRNSNHTFHPNAHTFTNGQGPHGYPMPNYNGVPRSPNGFGQDAFFAPSQQRFNRGYPARASSIPDGSYSRAPNGYAAPLHVNTGMPGNGMYAGDYAIPTTAYPYVPDPNQLLNAVTTQMEYYFSVDNLIKDMYLRKHMDSQGLVFLTFISDFKRLKSMTLDLELIKFVCQASPNIEHFIGSDGQDRLRATEGWEKWVLPMADRDPSAQNEGPESLQQPPKPHPQLYDVQGAMRHSSLPMPNSAGPVLGSQSFQSLNSFASPFGYGPNGAADMSSASFQTSPASVTHDQGSVQQPGPSYPGSSSQPSIFPSGFDEQEPDSFTDAEVESLRVVVRTLNTSDAGTSAPPMPSRTFSNGSLDGRNLAEDLNGLRIANAPAISNANATPSETDSRSSPAPSDRVNHFLLGSRLAGHRNPSRGGAGSEIGASYSPGIFWVKDKDSPATEIPPETTSDLYYTARQKALEQRHFQPCPYDMNVLYQFWSHFLIRNFNSRMYHEFRLLAIEDATTRNSFIGLNSLLKYFGGALTHDATLRRSVARDYVDLVRNENRESDRPAFKQLRNAWRDGALNMKNRKRIKDFMDHGLEFELDRL